MKWLFQALLRMRDFRGRSRRREFVGFIGLNMILIAMLFAAAAAMFPPTTGAEGALSPQAEAWLKQAMAVLAIPLALVNVPLAIRRAHDMGRNGWFCLPILLPYVGVAYVVWLALADGQPFPNAYGPDPKGRTPFDDDTWYAPEPVAAPLPATKVRRS